MIDADDLALLVTSFEAAMSASSDGGAPSPAAVDAALFELGWGDLLEVAPMQGAAAAFAALGRTGAVAGLLDDVVAHALGLGVGVDTCVVLPAPHAHEPAGSVEGGVLRVRGLVSARIDSASVAVVPVVDSADVRFVSVAAASLRSGSVDPHGALDPAQPYRRAIADVDVASVSDVVVTGSWSHAVCAARAALAHQLVAAARVMLDQARQHAVDRVQFGRAIASFQAVRHKLSETLVAIEGAAAVADVCTDDCEPITAAAAKSLAGKAARTAATHAQQVLAGIGFTTDHPFHLGLKRVMVLEPLFGSTRTLPVEIGQQLLAQREAPRLINL